MVRGCFNDLPPDMLKRAANQALGSKSRFWQQMKKKEKRKQTPKVFPEDGLYFWRQKNPKKEIGGKSLLAGNAGLSISGSKSLKHPLGGGGVG